MKPKTTRRFLTRNGWSIIRKKLIYGKFSGFVRTCLKVLKKDIRDTQNPASIRVHNKIIYR